MRILEEFAEFVQFNASLAPFLNLKVGGPAEALVQPRTREELSAVVRRCTEANIPFRVLGGGGNVLVRDEGVRGAVLRLSAPAFTHIEVQGRRVRSEGGAALSALISQSARHRLAGLETLVGIPGTVGGALRTNAGNRSGETGQYVRHVDVLDSLGRIHTRDRDELRFEYRWTNLDDPVILSAEFELEIDAPDAIVKRMRKAWIMRRASQPLSFQAATRIFKDPHGENAAMLIEQAGLAKTRVGGAEVSERNANYIVTQPGGTARDVLRLVDLVRSRVEERFQITLELDINVW
jgi:UDP-N-acetylmuramate dehydrogenase